MNDKYALFVWGSYGLTLAVLLWNWLAPRMQRNQVRARLSEAAAEDGET